MATEWKELCTGGTLDLPADVSSSDLFGGDLFGDELLDVYNFPANSVQSNEQAKYENKSEVFKSFQAFTGLKNPDIGSTNVSSTDFVRGPISSPVDVKDLNEVSASENKDIIYPKKHLNRSLTGKNHAAVVPLSLLPTGKGVKIGQTLHALAFMKHTPDPLDVGKVSTSWEGASVSDSSGQNIAVVPNQTVIDSKPVSVNSNEVKMEVNLIPKGISEANITAAAVPAVPVIAPKVDDFTAAAQAAISDLIASTCAQSVLHSSNINGNEDNHKQDLDEIPRKGFPDTTSALTSSQRVSSIDKNDQTNTTNVRSALSIESNSLTRATKRRKQNLTPDERAKQNRNRNREHARNTRLRKKAYVEELKSKITEFVAKRDAVDLEKRLSAQRELEQREVRFHVMEEFLKIRGSNEQSIERWTAILEDNFTLVIPLTRYRKMVHQSISREQRSILVDINDEGLKQSAHADYDDGKTEQILHGVEEVMADASSLAAFLGKCYSSENYIRKAGLSYDVKRSNFLMDSFNAVLKWTATTHSMDALPNLIPMNFKGSMRATFSPASNKLISVELYFDTGLILSQLKRINSEPPDFIYSQINSQQAAVKADAILSSLEMSCFLPNAVDHSKITFLPSVTASEKSESETDED